MSDDTMTGGRVPQPTHATARDAAGLLLLVLGTFVAASAAWDGWQGLDGGGENRSTAVVVRLIGWLGTVPLVAGGAVVALLGAFLFGRRERVVAAPLALGVLALLVALPFLAAFADPGGGGALGGLAAPAGAGTGARILSLALALTFGAASAYGLFAAFGRLGALTALLRPGVSGAPAAVKDSGPAALAATPTPSHVSPEGKGAHPRAAERGETGDGPAARGQRADAHLVAVPARGAAAAAAGATAARPLARGDDAGARERQGTVAPAAALTGHRAALAAEDGMRLVIGGRVVEPEGTFAGAGDLALDDLDALATVGSAGGMPVRPLGAGAVRPLGTTPPPAPPPAPLTAAEGPGAAAARPIGSAPASDPFGELAPLPAGMAGGAYARDIAMQVVAAPSTWRMDAAGVVHPQAALPETATHEDDAAGLLDEGDDDAAELEDGELEDGEVEESDDVELEEDDDAAELDEELEEEDDDAEAVEDDELEVYADDDEEEELDEDEDAEEDEEDAELDEGEEGTELVAEDDDAEDGDTEDGDTEDGDAEDGDDEEYEDEEEEDDDDADDESADAFEDEPLDDDALAAAAVEVPAAGRAIGLFDVRPSPARAASGPIDLFADAGVEEGVGRPASDPVLVPAAARTRPSRAALAPAPEPAAPKRSRKKPVPAPASALGDDAKERLIHDAGLLFLDEGRVAVSLLQKRFELDFQRSTEILDALQDRGLIGPYLGGQRRDILMTRDAWEHAQAAR